MKEYHERGDLVQVPVPGGSKFEWGIVVDSKEVFKYSTQRDYWVVTPRNGRAAWFYGPHVLTAEGDAIEYKERSGEEDLSSR